MKLELGCAQVNNVRFASESKVENGTTCVNAEELKALLLEDEDPKSVELGIMKSEGGVHIMPIRDVIGPHIRVNEDENLLPDTISKVEAVGSGRTSVLKDFTIVATDEIIGSQEGTIDICDEKVKYTPFSQLDNLVVVREPADRLAKHAHEKVVKSADLKAAGCIGRLAKGVKPDEVKVCETCSVKKGIEKYPELPRVAYVLVPQSQDLIHDTYTHRVDTKQSLPAILNPIELVNDIILSGNYVSTYNKNTAYHHLNNPIIADLFEQCGKTLSFVGVIITNESVYLVNRVHSSDWASRLCEFSGVDGAIISQEGFSSPNTDLIMNCKKIEAKDVKTVIVTDEYAGCDDAPQFLTDADASANAVVIGGNADMVINLPAMDRVIGCPEVADIITGRLNGSLQKDGPIVVELQMITGAIGKMGFNELGVR